MRKLILAVWLLVICVPKITIAQGNSTKTDSLRVHRSTIFKAAAFTSVYYVGSLYLLGETWFDDKKRVSFHFTNDNSGYLQVDKFGHAFGSYVYSYIGYHYLRHAGFTRNEALYFGATLGYVLQLPVEIMDGIHEGYGFSWGDIAANTVGSALVLGQELIFREQLVKYKFSYWESPYARKANGYLGESTFERIFEDYNAHTYWLSAPVNKLIKNKKIPGWLNIAAGYSANGMYGEFENITSYNGVAIPETERYRQYLLSFDIDWTKIKTNSGFLNIVLKGLTFVKLPFPALEYSSRGNFRGYWIYF